MMYKKGFISLFIVSLMSLLATMFLVISANRSSFQAQNLLDIQARNIARLNALSCIQIARLKIFLSETSVGDYGVENGTCGVESESRGSNYINLKTSAAKNDIKISFEAKLDVENLRILSLKEK